MHEERLVQLAVLLHTQSLLQSSVLALLPATLSCLAHELASNAGVETAWEVCSASAWSARRRCEVSGAGMPWLQRRPRRLLGHVRYMHQSSHTSDNSYLTTTTSNLQT